MCNDVCLLFKTWFGITFLPFFDRTWWTILDFLSFISEASLHLTVHVNNMINYDGMDIEISTEKTRPMEMLKKKKVTSMN